MHISPLLKEIKADQTIEASNYSGMRTSRFILPGYLLEGDEDWPQRMCKVLSKCVISFSSRMIVSKDGLGKKGSSLQWFWSCRG